jgi:hypothetical protein
MDTEQFALLLEAIKKLNENIELIESRLYTVEQCIWQNPSNRNDYQFKIHIQQ